MKAAARSLLLLTRGGTMVRTLLLAATLVAAFGRTGFASEKPDPQAPAKAGDP